MANNSEIEKLHAEVSVQAKELEQQHAARLKCEKGCSACCLDGLSVLEIEADRIRKNHEDLLQDGQPHPAGACAFLDETGACRVYPDRPYICRTQGLPLGWFEEDNTGEITEHRDICELNREGPPLEQLELEQVWILGPVEQRLVQMQDRRKAGAPRVPLRSLFRRH